MEAAVASHLPGVVTTNILRRSGNFAGFVTGLL
jgi:hypothetical protein